MTTARQDSVLRYIRKLAVSRDLQERSSQELLDAFAAHEQEAAFAVLVARHGPMVLRVCRRVLGHEQDAEDAFQATFLVLAGNSKKIRKPEALADWLHGVAYRIAMNAKRNAARRRAREKRLLPERRPSPTLTWNEIQPALDEELRRLSAPFRLAFVLCVLEGKTEGEAAAIMGCKLGTASSRLARARHLLQQRLTRRGIHLGSLLATLAVAEGAPRAVASALTQSTVKYGLLAAAGAGAASLIPAQVRALAQGVSAGIFSAKLKVAVVVMIGAGLLAAGAGVAAQQVLATAGPLVVSQNPKVGGNTSEFPASKTKVAKEEDEVQIRGRVMDPAGKPFPGASLYWRPTASTSRGAATEQARSDTDGQFVLGFKRSLLISSWFHIIAGAKGYGPGYFAGKLTAGMRLDLHLLPDVPVQGRLLDINGKPVQGATLQIESIESYSNTEEFLQSIRDQVWPPAMQMHWSGPFPGQARELTTDAGGRFRLTGIGKDRLVRFEVTGPTIRWGPLHVLARQMKGGPVQPRVRQSYGVNVVPVYPADFDCVFHPSRLIQGVVRDKITRQPLPGIPVGADVRRDGVVTDAAGRFKLEGIGKDAEGYRLHVRPSGKLYFSRWVVLPDTPGLDPVEGDIELTTGSLIKGRVTQRETGEPLVGVRVEYNPFFPNPFVSRRLGPESPDKPCSWTITAQDGSYALVVLPGPGMLGFRADSPTKLFMPALVTAGELRDFFKDNVDRGDEHQLKTQASKNAMSVVAQSEFHRLVLINPGDKEEGLTRDVTLEAARKVRGFVLDPDGRPVNGVTAYHLAPGVMCEPLRSNTFTVEGLNPRKTHYLLFIDKERKYGAFMPVNGEVKGPLTVRLAPCGSVRGRLLDQDGQVVAGATVRLDAEEVYDSSPDHVKTNREGCFHFDGIVPGQRYQARLGPRMAYSRLGHYLSRAFTIKAGEIKDLGDVRVSRQQ
jgi:RNA polymerase sigma factor (sigma-70 family)